MLLSNVQKPSRKDNHKSLGVEHASTEAIQRHLESVHEISTVMGEPVISQETLMALGFVRTTRFSNKTSSGGGFFSKNWLPPRMENSSRKDYNYFVLQKEQLRAALRSVLRK